MIPIPLISVPTAATSINTDIIIPTILNPLARFWYASISAVSSSGFLNFLPHFFFLHVRDKHDQHLTYINQDTTREIPSFIFFGLNNFILTFSF